MIRIFVFLTVLLFVSCAQKKIVSSMPEGYTGKLADKHEVDGCGWIIVIDKPIEDGITTYHPLNLSEFDLRPRDQMAVRFTFDYEEGSSICMMGKLIKLKTLSEIKP